MVVVTGRTRGMTWSKKPCEHKAPRQRRYMSPPPPPLMRCCLHSQGRPDLSLAIYLQLQLPSVFDFIKVAGGGGGGGGKRRLEGCTWCPTPQHPCRH